MCLSSVYFFNFFHDIYPTLEDRILISNFNFVFQNYLSIETVFCRLLQQMLTIEIDLNLKKWGQFPFNLTCD